MKKLITLLFLAATIVSCKKEKDESGSVNYPMTYVYKKPLTYEAILAKDSKGSIEPDQSLVSQHSAPGSSKPFNNLEHTHYSETDTFLFHSSTLAQFKTSNPIILSDFRNIDSMTVVEHDGYVVLKKNAKANGISVYVEFKLNGKLGDGNLSREFYTSYHETYTSNSSSSYSAISRTEEEVNQIVKNLNDKDFILYQKYKGFYYKQ